MHLCLGPVEAVHLIVYFVRAIHIIHVCNLGEYFLDMIIIVNYFSYLYLSCEALWTNAYIYVVVCPWQEDQRPYLYIPLPPTPKKNSRKFSMHVTEFIHSSLFYSFPKDPERRRLWEQQLRRENFEATDHTRICSKHFTDDCFDKAKFGGTHLKKDVFPTIFNFPQHLQKQTCTRKPPQKRLKSSENTSVDCQNEGKIIFLGMGNDN